MEEFIPQTWTPPSRSEHKQIRFWFHKLSTAIPACVLLLQLLKENILAFVESELKVVQRRLSYDYPEGLEEEEELQGSREAFLKIAVNFLRRMKQEVLADHLQSGEQVPLTTLDVFDPCCFSRNISEASSCVQAAQPRSVSADSSPP